MSDRKKETLTLSINPGDKEKLEKIAKQLGLLWGNNPSISHLLSALAEGEIIAISKEEAEEKRKKLLDSAFLAQAELIKIIQNLS